jgi:hypothetical protein
VFWLTCLNRISRFGLENRTELHLSCLLPGVLQFSYGSGH